MSLDGCLEVAWKGQAFPYLMHHPDPSSERTPACDVALQGTNHGCDVPKQSTWHKTTL